jgi:hypothetical protein
VPLLTRDVNTTASGRGARERSRVNATQASGHIMLQMRNAGANGVEV